MQWMRVTQYRLGWKKLFLLLWSTQWQGGGRKRHWYTLQGKSGTQNPSLFFTAVFKSKITVKKKYCNETFLWSFTSNPFLTKISPKIKAWGSNLSLGTFKKIVLRHLWVEVPHILSPLCHVRQLALLFEGIWILQPVCASGCACLTRSCGWKLMV